MKADDIDFEVKAVIKSEKNKLEKSNNFESVLISREIMSGDLFDFYKNSHKHYFRLSKVFPKAIIICSLRFQTDWLISCYRESIHEHHYQSVDSFLELHEEKCNNFVHNNFKVKFS